MSAPAPGTRMRAKRDHQIGWLIEDNGSLMIKLDRKEEQLVPYTPHTWEVDPDRPMAPIQVARIAYEADRALRTVIGEYGLKEWSQMPEVYRVGWANGIPRGKDGKPVDAKRQRLYQAITEALSKP